MVKSPESYIVAAPLIWALHFVLCYSALSVGCAFGWQAGQILGLDVIRILLLLLTAAAIVALLLLLRAALRVRQTAASGSRPRFSASTAAGLVVLSLIAVVWIGFAIGFMPPCQ